MPQSNGHRPTFGELAESVSVTHSFSKPELIFLNTSDIDRGRVLHRDYTPVATWPGQAKKSIQKGDILFSEIRPANGRYAFVDFDADDYVVSTKLMVIRPKPEKVSPRFLYHFLTSRKITDWLQHLAESRSGTFPQITFDQVAELDLPRLLPEEQRTIGELFDALDDKIEQNRRTARALERLARAIFRAWFVDFEPVKAKAGGATSFPSIPQSVFDALPIHFVDSDIGPVPEGWEVKALSSVCTLVGGGTPKRSESAYWGGDVPWYSVKDAPSDGEIWVINTSEQITDHGLANSAARIVPKGSTIISARGTVGKLAMAGTAMAFNQSCYGLLPGNGSSFGHLHLLLQAAVAQLQQRTHGSVFDTITGATFDGLMVAKPKDDVVSAFEVVVAPLLDVLLASLLESSKVAEVRDYLLPKLVSGNVRVEVARG